MAIHVYHNPRFLDCFQRPILDCIDPSSLYLAAIVATDEPETAYRLTQHADANWYDNPAVTTVVHSRSTSVGDLLLADDGRLLVVMSFGYQELDMSLPADESALVRSLHEKTAVDQARYVYTALTFALPLLEQMADDVDRPDPQQALLARFAAEQARGALDQADGG